MTWWRSGSGSLQVSGVWQCRHVSARSSTMSSGGRVCRVCLVCPCCPPLDLPEGGLGGAGLAKGGSEDGGLEELDEFWLSRTSSSAIRASRVETKADTAA